MFMDPSVPLLAAMGLQLILLQVNQRLGSPILSIVNRWMRWGIFAGGAAYLCREFGWIDRPYWLLALAFALVWFLCETIYNWMAITALSLSPLPLFPKYVVHEGGEEWPVQPRLRRVRDVLRSEGFSHVQSLRSEVAPGVHLRVGVYDTSDATVRAQAMFLPQPGNSLTLCFVLISHLADGRRLVTDNITIPFGGFYPENWMLERRPWIRSFGSLLKRHRERLTEVGQTAEAIAIDPWSDIAEAQKELDRLNTDLGFLQAPRDREEFGKITQEGRYRVWKEIWMLEYLGRSMRY